MTGTDLDRRNNTNELPQRSGPWWAGGFVPIALYVVLMVWSGTSADAQSDTFPIARDNPARIWIDGDRLYFFGETSPASVEAFEAFVTDHNTSAVNRLVVNSGGGDTRSARKLGQWIFEHRLDVEVSTICYSSCANYIFPAGARKFIDGDAFVGWHGSETQNEILAEGTPGESPDDLIRQALEMALRSALPKDTPADQIEKEVEHQMELFKSSQQEERAFFERLGLDREFTIHGLRPGNLNRLNKDSADGWTYTLEDMARLGLGTAEYLGAGRYSKSDAVTRHVPVIP